jgi:DNA-binding IclR family transcriptional regulator
MTTSEKANKLTGAQTIAKAALVLRSLSTFGSGRATLKDVSEVTGLPKPTAHRILAALRAERLIERPEGTREYRLGPELFAFGAIIADAFDLKGLARGSLERLARETGDTIYLGVRCGFDALCLDRACAASAPDRMFLEVMNRWPLGIGSFSLAILSFLPDPEIAEVVEYNRRRLSGKDLATFERIGPTILKTRSNGYAFRRTSSQRGLAGVAVPVIDRKLRPVASLCAAAGAQRMTGKHLDLVVRSLRREAAAIARKCEVARLRGDARETWRAALGHKI